MPSSAAAADTPSPAAAAASMAAIAPRACRGRRRARPGPSSRAPSPAPGRPPALQALGGAGHARVVPLPRGAVVVLDDHQADRHRVPLLAELGHEHEVAERLRHLLAVHADHRLVHPVAHERLAGGRLRLGPLALVVGEDQVGAAAVQVDGGAELAQGQRRALDVPAGRPGPHRRLPRRLVVERRLPQHEVERVALVRVVDVAAALGGEREHLLAACSPTPSRTRGTTTRRSTRRRRPGRRGRGRAPCR